MNAFIIHCICRLLGTALLVLSNQLAFAQPSSNFVRESVHRVWRTDDGLPQNSVNAIVQTKDGYLWMGTQEGLARFNGVTFRVFDKRAVKAMKSNDVRVLMEDREGNLWIGTSRGGLMKYRAGDFQSYTNTDGLADDSVSAILQDAGGDLWIGTPNGLNKFHQGKFLHYGTAEGLSDNLVNALAETSHGDLWIGTKNGLDRVTQGNFHPEAIGHLLHGIKITALQADEDALWIATESSGVYRLSSGKLTHYNSRNGLPDVPVNSIMQDKDGVWVGTYGRGFCRLPRDGKEKFDCFTSSDGLNDNVVFSIRRDREGSLWVGTLTGGLNQFKRTGFTMLDHTRAGATPARSVYEGHDGSIWVGTDAGLHRYRNGDVQSYPTRNGVANNFVRSVMEGRDGSIWAATKNGLNQFRNGIARTYTTSDGLPDNRVHAVYQDHSGAIWIGTEHGVSRFINGQFQKFNPQSGAPAEMVWSIFEDHNHDIWLGTFGRLYLFRDGRFVPEKEDSRLSIRDVTFFYEDPGHVLWLATAGDGLKRLEKGKTISYLPDQGLFDDTIWAILEDEQGNFWMSSNHGIFKVSKGELNAFAAGQLSQIRSIPYNATDGASDECNGGSQNPALKASNGELLFSCVNGVVVAVAPDKFPHNVLAPPVVVEKALLNGEPVNPGAEITAGRDKLEIYFAALSYLAPSHNTFKYKLEPYDIDWTFTSKNEANYANLPPGRYQFRVLAANNDGTWNIAAASFGFYLKPRFYQARWFFWVCGLSAALLGFAIYQLRARQIRNREKELQRQVDERTSQLQQEIEERREIEQALARTAAIVESSSDAIWSTDLQGITITWNSGAEKLFGYCAQEMIGQPIFSIIPPERNQEVVRFFERLKQGKALSGIETVRQTKSGELLELSLSLSPILKDKKIIGISVIARDISERKRAEKALQQAKEAAEAATRAKSEFLANMSHEIRTPLNGVIGMLELASNAELPPEQSDLVNTAQDSANTLLVIINEILDFSKIEAGKMDLDLLEFNLDEAVSESLRTLALRAHEKHLELHCHIAPDVPRCLLGDVARLKQVLVNLVGNAIKFTGHGQVALRVDPEKLNGDQLELKFSVADTGVGIPLEKREMIFEPFLQGDASITRKYGGTGLGLAICSRLVKLMDGRLWLESEIGKGSTFYFTAVFKLVEGHTNHVRQAEILSGIGQDSSRKLKVLLVEDNVVNQKLVARFLERAGHAAAMAGNGREALEKLADENFDLVLMDVQMPEMDGIAATQAIRAQEQITKAHIPIIAMTAHAMKGDRERCLAAGMDEYLAKPLTQRDLLETIHRVLQNALYQTS